MNKSARKLHRMQPVPTHIYGKTHKGVVVELYQINFKQM